MRVSAMANVSFYEALELISYADGLRLLNQWWLDNGRKAQLRFTGKIAETSIEGLFSR